MHRIKLLAIVAVGAGVLCSCAAPAAAGTDANALEMALEDEYLAEATYDAILDKFGDVRPFINIIEAERRHSSRVKEEMGRLGLEFEQENPLIGQIEAPSSLLEACELGVTAETDNIALYERILPQVTDSGARKTLTDLQWASRERHLPAFERCVARGGTSGGGGPGRGMGQGMKRGGCNN